MTEFHRVELVSKAPANVPTPAAGKVALFADSSNSDHVSQKNSAGVVTDLAADPVGTGANFSLTDPGYNTAFSWSASILTAQLYPSIVADIPALIAIDTTTLPPRTPVYVQSTGELCILNKAATAGTYTPTTGTGFWHPTIGTQPVSVLSEYSDCAGLASAAINGWQATVVSAGTIAVVTTSVATFTVGINTATQAANLANHPGVLSFTSSTTANSGAQYTWGAATAGVTLKGGEVAEFIFFPINFATSTYRFGIHDASTSADAVDGVYFEMSTSGVLTGKASNNSVRTTSAAIATLTAATWYHARLKLNANATAVTFTVYNQTGAVVGTPQTVTTNIPTAVGRDALPRFIVTNSGVTATLLAQLDLAGWKSPVTRGAKYQ